MNQINIHAVEGTFQIDCDATDDPEGLADHIESELTEPSREYDPGDGGAITFNRGP